MTENGGTLYVVSTPIGNMGDFSFRAVETLRAVAAVLATDRYLAPEIEAAHSMVLDGSLLAAAASVVSNSGGELV